jgi:hypothetical protein
MDGAAIFVLFVIKKVKVSGCERLRLPHYLDKQLIDGVKVVSPTR